MPLTLLAVLWMVLLRSGRSEQARFARVAAALREENMSLNQSMHALGLRLADARKQLGEQAKLVQQLGLDTVSRLTESSDKLASNASVIANAHDQLARSGDVRSEEHTSELQSLMRNSYAVLCLKKKNNKNTQTKIDDSHKKIKIKNTES